ncbi:ABC transporter permease subunit [Cellulomonas sp. B6]|uniref:ABC transporter permease subunit n=1 Tax=Cellulomonas sp. B6 TaxID=1295626 RepID=UPI00073B8C93|nr:ABC transporter permease subunit [Cellulomonas sp. B6]KSW19041.1 hypothetical protein ATM99_16940 [Cellulomonas sp. B6]
MTTAAVTRTTVQPVTFRRLVTSEHVKMRSLRSTWWALAVAVAFFPLFSAMRTSSMVAVAADASPEYLVGPVYVTSGLALAQLVLCGLAVVTITAEYRTGQVRSTLTAAPTRLPALGAKLLVVVVTALATGLVGVLVGWAAAAPTLGAARMTVDLTQAEHLRLMFGVPLYLAAITAFAFGVGAILRSSAAGIASVLGLVFVVEPAFSYVPWAPLQQIATYLPTAAGSRLISSDTMGSVIAGSQSTTLSAWQGYGVLLAWAAAALLVAAVLLRRRDA